MTGKINLVDLAGSENNRVRTRTDETDRSVLTVTIADGQ